MIYNLKETRQSVTAFGSFMDVISEKAALIVIDVQDVLSDPDQGDR